MFDSFIGCFIGEKVTNRQTNTQTNSNYIDIDDLGLTMKTLINFFRTPCTSDTQISTESFKLRKTSQFLPVILPFCWIEKNLEPNMFIFLLRLIFGYKIIFLTMISQIGNIIISLQDSWKTNFFYQDLGPWQHARKEDQKPFEKGHLREDIENV